VDGTNKAEDAWAGAERNYLSGEPKEKEGRKKQMSGLIIVREE
jgi:hypothetical protein